MSGGQDGTPAARLDVAEFDEVGRQGEAVEFEVGETRAGEDRPTTALRDRLVGAGGQDPVTYRNQRDHRPANVRRSSDRSAIRPWSVSACSGVGRVVVDRIDDRGLWFGRAVGRGPTG